MRLKVKPKQDRPQPATRPRQGRFCELCGRARSGEHQPFCASCTDMFTLPHGQSLYDENTGEMWVRSKGGGRLVSPGWWDEHPAPHLYRHAVLEWLKLN